VVCLRPKGNIVSFIILISALAANTLYIL